VDNNLNPVPVGVPGEVLIGGAGPARGYLNNEALTKQKFIPNLYAPPEYTAKGWITAYRSGDRGRLRADGALLFDGRIDGDSQIKLRGLRIELEDIESSITKTSKGALVEAIVSVRGDPEFLVAHVVFAPSHASADQEAFLRKVRAQLPLPQYMCPAIIIPVERMPLTPHLKIDRRAVKALPLPDSTTSTEDDGGRELSDTEVQLLDIWKTIISAEAAKAFTIDAGTDFFHLGGSSMLLPKLQAKVRVSLGVVLPLAAFFESSTLGGMASKIRETASSTTIDWATETAVSELALEAGKLKLHCIDDSSKISGGKTILLTGATGFLGRAILKQLVDDDVVEKIHCISVRPKAGGSQRKLAVESSKIVIHSGDLTSPFLGLADEEFAGLASSVDMIIHSGAMRAFFEYYQLVRKTNVTSTRELIKMALPRKIPIQFISSGGLLTFVGGNVSTASSVAHLTPPTDGTEGYLCSKFASEVSLENAAAEYGLPIRIHRGLKVAGETDETQLQNILQSLLGMTNTMNLLPDLAGWVGDLDFVPTATIVNGLCKHISEGYPSESCASYEHYPGVVKLDVPYMARWLEKNVDVEKFGRLNVLKWLGRIKNLGFEHVIAAQYLALEGVEGAVSRR
jgi:hybrid polyketide synthase/nonribosomal peptide synthetase ACE1